MRYQLHMHEEDFVRLKSQVDFNGLLNNYGSEGSIAGMPVIVHKDSFEIVPKYDTWFWSRLVEIFPNWDYLFKTIIKPAAVQPGHAVRMADYRGDMDRRMFP